MKKTILIIILLITMPLIAATDPNLPPETFTKVAPDMLLITQHKHITRSYLVNRIKRLVERKKQINAELVKYNAQLEALK